MRVFFIIRVGFVSSRSVFFDGSFVSFNIALYTVAMGASDLYKLLAVGARIGVEIIFLLELAALPFCNFYGNWFALKDYY